MNDTVSDMLTRIKNAYMARHKTVVIPHSNLRKELALVLKETGFVSDVKQVEGEHSFTIFLKYTDGVPALTQVQRISKPGRRMYTSVKDLHVMKNRLGFIILSTPKGVRTHLQARKDNVGGELLCKVW